MSTPYPLPPKKEVALALLERSNVHVHLDPRGDRVTVPAWFKNQPRLVLQIGLSMPVPIPDLHLDDEGMSCTLSFSRRPFHCVVPWSSVFAMVGDDQRGMVWPDDVPPEIALEQRAQPAQPAPAPSPVAAVPAEKRDPEPKRAPKRARAGEAEAEAAPADKPRAKKGRSKKARAEAEVEPEIRPVLVAVPVPAGAEKRQAPRAELADKKRADKMPAPAAPAASAHGRPHRPQPAAGPPKPKRELPPYLRVVK
jgi:hypothetical protein